MLTKHGWFQKSRLTFWFNSACPCIFLVFLSEIVFFSYNFINYVCLWFLQPRYQWMRGRMQGFSVKVILYTRDMVIRSISKVLVRVGEQQLLDQFLQRPFRYITEVNKNDTTTSALQELQGRELKDSSFSEFWDEVFDRGMKFDSALKSGSFTELSFEPSPFDPYARQIIPLSSLYHTKCERKKIKLMDDFFWIRIVTKG